MMHQTTAVYYIGQGWSYRHGSHTCPQWMATTVTDLNNRKDVFFPNCPLLPYVPWDNLNFSGNAGSLLKTANRVLISNIEFCFEHDGAQQADLPKGKPNTQDGTIALLINALQCFPHNVTPLLSVITGDPEVLSVSKSLKSTLNTGLMEYSGEF